MKRITWTSLIALSLVIVGCAGEMEDVSSELRNHGFEGDDSVAELRLYVLKYGDLTALTGAEVDIRDAAAPSLPAFPAGEAPSAVTDDDGAAEITFEGAYWNRCLAITMNRYAKSYIYTSHGSLHGLNDRTVAVMSDEELVALYGEAGVKPAKGTGTIILSATDALGAPLEKASARLYTMTHAVSLDSGSLREGALPMSRSDDFAFVNVPAGPNAIVVTNVFGETASVEFEVEAGAVTMLDVSVGASR